MSLIITHNTWGGGVIMFTNVYRHDDKLLNLLQSLKAVKYLLPKDSIQPGKYNFTSYVKNVREEETK